jgi:hypothetical protein
MWDTPGVDPFLELARRDPPRESLYKSLASTNDFLVSLRSAYRVAVSATATIERDQLLAPARILGYENRDGVTGADRLFAELERQMAESARTVDRLLASTVGTNLTPRTPAT